MDKNRKFVIYKILGGVAGGSIGMVAGFMAGATYGGNFAVGFRFLGLRGYEATGIIGIIIGALVGAIVGVFFVRHTQKQGQKGIVIDINIALIIGSLFVIWLVVPIWIAHSQYKNTAHEIDLTKRDAWTEIVAVIEDAIYYEDVDALLALTFPGSVSKELVEEKLQKWRDNKYQFSGMGAMIDFNDDSKAYIGIGGLSEKLTVNRIEGRWYLVLE